MLLLFDIDGTLVRERPLAHQQAMFEAMRTVFGVELSGGHDAVRAVSPWGKTDLQIARDMLEREGLGRGPTGEELAALEREACRVHHGLERPLLTGAARERTEAALAELRDAGHRLVLLTGNLEPIARRKMDLCGLGGYFEAGQGAFGSDSERRPELVPIARRRAGDGSEPHPREDTLLIGDTPLDVAAATADGVRCVAVAGPRFGREELLAAGAADVVDEVAELPQAVRGLARRPLSGAE